MSNWFDLKMTRWLQYTVEVVPGACFWRQSIKPLCFISSAKSSRKTSSSGRPQVRKTRRNISATKKAIFSMKQGLSIVIPTPNTLTQTLPALDSGGGDKRNWLLSLDPCVTFSYLRGRLRCWTHLSADPSLAPFVRGQCHAPACSCRRQSTRDAGIQISKSKLLRTRVQ